MCATTLHFSGLQLVFDPGALQPSLQLPGCLATGFRCVFGNVNVKSSFKCLRTAFRSIVKFCVLVFMVFEVVS